MLPEAANVSLALAAYKQIADRFQQEISVFANFLSSYLGLINDDETTEFSDGALRLIGPKGDTIEDGITAQRFTRDIRSKPVITATPSLFTTNRLATQKAATACPLARLNIVKSMGTLKADLELAGVQATVH